MQALDNCDNANPRENNNLGDQGNLANHAGLALDLFKEGQGVSRPDGFPEPKPIKSVETEPFNSIELKPLPRDCFNKLRVAPDPAVIFPDKPELPRAIPEVNYPDKLKMPRGVPWNVPNIYDPSQWEPLKNPGSDPMTDPPEKVNHFPPCGDPGMLTPPIPLGPGEPNPLGIPSRPDFFPEKVAPYAEPTSKGGLVQRDPPVPDWSDPPWSIPGYNDPPIAPVKPGSVVMWDKSSLR